MRPEVSRYPQTAQRRRVHRKREAELPDRTRTTQQPGEAGQGARTVCREGRNDGDKGNNNGDKGNNSDEGDDGDGMGLYVPDSFFLQGRKAKQYDHKRRDRTAGLVAQWE